MISAIITDVGGVLHTRAEQSIFLDVMRTLDIAPDVFKKVWPPLARAFANGQIDERIFWSQLFLQANVTRPLPPESLWLRAFARLFQPHTEVLDYIQALQYSGYRTVALANMIPPHVEFLRSHGVFEPFDAQIFSYEVGMIKPDVAMFQLALDKLGVQARDVVFIDDLSTNVDAALRMGMHGVVFHDAEQLIHDLEALGVSPGRPPQ